MNVHLLSREGFRVGSERGCGGRGGENPSAAAFVGVVVMNTRVQRRRVSVCVRCMVVIVVETGSWMLVSLARG